MINTLIKLFTIISIFGLALYYYESLNIGNNIDYHIPTVQKSIILNTSTNSSVSNTITVKNNSTLNNNKSVSKLNNSKSSK